MRQVSTPMLRTDQGAGLHQEIRCKLPFARQSRHGYSFYKRLNGLRIALYNQPSSANAFTPKICAQAPLYIGIVNAGRVYESKPHLLISQDANHHIPSNFDIPLDVSIGLPGRQHVSSDDA
jgi:hypothetical protein